MQDDLRQSARSFREAARRIRPHPANPMKVDAGAVARFVDTDCVGVAHWMDEAAARIAALEAENERLRGSSIRNFRKVEG